MAVISSPRYLLAFFLLILYLKVMDADPNLAFSFKNFGKDSNFESNFALFGDAEVSRDNLSVRISGSGGVGSGRFFYRKPFNLVEGKLGSTVSFSNHFVFSMSGENGDGLAFVMLPYGINLSGFNGGSMGVVGERKLKFLAVEFDTFKDEKYGDMNGNHVGIDVESFVSVKAGNVSSIDLVLNSGEKLQAWIDYEASGKRFEVRLSKLGEIRPLDPFLSYPIDLSKMWKDENVSIGLSSSSGNSSQKCSVFSWSFKSRTMPHWMHSQPMNPEGILGKEEEAKAVKKGDCAVRILGALILGTGCGAIGALLVMFMWSMFGNRRPVVPLAEQKEMEYKKIDVSVSKTVEDGKD